MHSFNLVDEDWIPCLMPGGELKEKSLAEVLANAVDIREISDGSPLVVAAVHRLLLAILHRIFGPEGDDVWKAMWNGGNGGWDVGKANGYFVRWRHRFDMFDSTHPFYQCASLRLTYVGPKGKQDTCELNVSSLVHQLAPYLNKATLFDHTSAEAPVVIGPAESTRLLLAFQSYAIGGFSPLSRPRIKGEESAKAAPLVKGALVLAKGENLFQTLMLNLVKYSPRESEPFSATSDDAPAWERDSETSATERVPKGYLDLLTWQSRRVRFVPVLDVNGNTVVKNVIVRKGNEFAGDLSPHARGEPMFSYVAAKKAAKNQDPWPPVSFRSEKDLWRDSLALFQSIEKERSRPKTLDWLSDLADSHIIPWSSVYNLELIGMISDQATIDTWRHERLPLPLKYLEDKNLLIELKDALRLAEDAGNTLRRSAWLLAKLVIAPAADALNDLQKKEVDGFIKHLSTEPPYWARLGLCFNRLVVDLADQEKDANAVMNEWADEVGKSARQAFREATDSLDHNGRFMRAVTEAENGFQRGLNTLLKEFREQYPYPK